MRKALLIKYIEGATDSVESGTVVEWLKRDKKNLDYFLELKNFYVINHLPNTDATAGELKQMAELYKHAGIGNNRHHRFFKYTVAACILFLLGLNMYFIFDKIQSSSAIQSTSAQSAQMLENLPLTSKHIIYTNKGVKSCIDLPDGSKVWLNSDTKITFPLTFKGDTREVKLEGEAFFDVITDSLKPMIISTNKNFKVKVLGTKFNIKSYSNDTEAKTTLISGIVEILKGNKNNKEEVIVRLKEQEVYVLDDKLSQKLIMSADTSRQTAWKRGVLIFESTPIKDVLKELSRWYGTEFIVENSKIYDFKFTAELNSESLIQIMEMLKYCTSTNYTIKNNQVRIK